MDSDDQLVNAGKEAVNALLDYVERIENNEGASLYYGHSVIRQLLEALEPHVHTKWHQEMKAAAIKIGGKP
jgi:hypothetical protein